VQELKNTKKELYFYTKRYRVTVQDQLSCVGVDCLLLVVTDPKDLPTPMQIQLNGSESLFAQNKVVVLVKPSYAVPHSYFYLYCGLADATQFSRRN
jgi:hypothetical protein